MKPELHNFHGLISTLHMRTVMLHGHAGKDPGEMVVCKDKSLLDRGDCKVPASCCFEKLERGSFKERTFNTWAILNTSLLANLFSRVLPTFSCARVFVTHQSLTRSPRAL